MSMIYVSMRNVQTIQQNIYMMVIITNIICQSQFKKKIVSSPKCKKEIYSYILSPACVVFKV